MLLHMARQGEDWKGKAISFTHGCECRFTSLADLIAWLDLQEQPDSEEPA